MQKKRMILVIFDRNLARIFKTFRNFAEYWGYEKDPYDALLGYYAEDLTTETIDTMTAQLKPVLIGLLNQVEEKNKNGSAPKKIDIGPVSREQQQAVWTMILKKLVSTLTAEGWISVHIRPSWQILLMI